MSASRKPLGFWTCWSLTVGTMIGSGIFTVPAVLAPYGLLSFGGWLIAGAGSILLALMLARLAARTTRSGGPYVYVRDAFGELPGFLVAWGHWASYWIALPAIAIAFVGYLPVFEPSLADNAVGQAAAALALIWALTLLAVRGIREAGAAQVLMTMLKIVPLLIIIAFAAFAGESANLPALNPSNAGIAPALAATALLTMWAFSGLEGGCMPASDVKDAARTIPKALIAGVISVAALYIGATLAVSLLLTPATLAQSSAPFADAARGLGNWGPALIAAGALLATAGALNGSIFVSGQIPMAVALDRLAPAFLARRNGGDAPYAALILSAVLASLLLLANYTRGMIGAFTFLLMMSTVATLIPLFVCALVELRHSWRNAKAWALVALLAAAFCAFAIIGSGREVLFWGLVLLAAGLPVYYLGRQKLGAQPTR